MEHSLDIMIVPDDEVPIYFIRNKIYSKFHRTLSTLKATGIGVSFPNFKEKLGADRTQKLLGNIIRIHGSENSLNKLQSTNWLSGLVGYCDVSTIQSIPGDVKHRSVSRIQSNMTASKLRRLIKRGSINADEANQYKAKMFSQRLDLPYLDLESSSNGHKHRRYIQFGKISDTSVLGEFDQFGLSKTATIPWF
jgi:CRISPR-associated endonuclease Csy4